MSWLESYVEKQKKAIDSINLDSVDQIIQVFKAAIKEGRKIFVIGNGGSAANASHFATDLGKGSSDVMKKFIERAYEVGEFTGKERFQVMSLNDNVSWMTAIANDYSYDEVFSRQLKNFASHGDIILAVSVSGNSPNLVKAFQYAKDIGMYTISLTSHSGGEISKLSDRNVRVQSGHYGHVEDCQMMILHMIAYYFMEKYDFERKPSYHTVKSIDSEK